MDVSEIYEYMMDHDKNPLHAIHVAELSLLLYDQLKEWHQNGDRSRFLLQGAAYLHDIGLTISHKKHHIHSYRIIQNANFSSFCFRDKQIIGNIARYHRKSPPSLKHSEFAILDPTDQQIVMKMSPLLRIANALDSSHKSCVQDLVCSVHNHQCRCTLVSSGNCMHEKSCAMRRKRFFVDVYKLDFVIVEERKVDDLSSRRVGSSTMLTS